MQFICVLHQSHLSLLALIGFGNPIILVSFFK